MADTVDLQKLVVSLEARTAQFEKQLARAERASKTQANKITSNFARMNREVAAQQIAAAKKLQTSFAGLAGSVRGVAGFFGLSLGVQTVVDLANKLDELGDVAERTGVSVEHLQAAMKLAEQTGSSGSTLLAGIDRFNTLLGEGAAKANDLTKFLELNGVALRKQDGTLRSTQELWEEFLNLVGRFNTEAGRAAAISATLGPRFDELGNFAKNGAKGVGDMQARMASLGQLINAQTIQKIGEYKDALADISSSAIAEAAKILVELATAIRDVNSAIEAGLKWLGGGGEQKSITDPNFTIGNFPSRPLPILEGDTSVRGSEAADALNDVRTAIQGVEQDIRDLESANLEDALLPLPEAMAARTAAIEAQRQRLQMLREEYILLTGAARDAFVTPGAPAAPAAPGTVPATRTGDEMQREDFSERFVGATPGEIDETTISLEKLDEVKTDLAQPEPLMPSAAEDLDSVADSAGDVAEQLNIVTDRFAEIRPMAEDFLNTLADGLLDSKSLVDSLADALEDLGRQLIRMGISQIAGAIFPAGVGLFGRAQGGLVNQGQPYRVHEGEIVVPRIPAKVIPAHRAGGGSGPPISISQVINVAGNADQNTVALIREGVMRDMESSLPSMIRKAHSNRTL